MARASSFVRIPKERVGVLVGPDGRVKQNIQDRLSVELQIESDGGGINIMLSENAKDPSLLLKAKDVVTAIGRGFSPEHAFRLIRNEEAVLDVIDLRTIFGKSDSDIKRIKGRIIGMNGKTRRTIEELTDTNVTVYGHTISMIGTFEQVEAARSAIQMLIDGSQHHTVYRFLQRKRRELKKKMLELWEKPSEEK
jgi:ribosomal RNA assembly protein